MRDDNALLGQVQPFRGWTGGSRSKDFSGYFLHLQNVAIPALRQGIPWT